MPTIRYAFFSDIHANLPALKAVLADIDSQNIDFSYCLGELVDFAPWPNEVISLLQQRNIPTVMGNHDERILHNHPVKSLSWHSLDEQIARSKAIEISRASITPENKRYLAALPGFIRTEIPQQPQNKKLFITHGSPHSLSEYIYPDFPESRLADFASQYDFDILITGHTHVPYQREIECRGRRILVANCGTVGRMKKIMPCSTWLMMTADEHGVAFTVRQVCWDVQMVAQSIFCSEIPDYYAHHLLQC